MMLPPWPVGQPPSTAGEIAMRFSNGSREWGPERLRVRLLQGSMTLTDQRRADCACVHSCNLLILQTFTFVRVPVLKVVGGLVFLHLRDLDPFKQPSPYEGRVGQRGREPCALCGFKATDANPDLRNRT